MALLDVDRGTGVGKTSGLWGLSVCTMDTLIHAFSGDVMGLYCKTYKEITELKNSKSTTSVTTHTTAYSKETAICFRTDNNTQ